MTDQPKWMPSDDYVHVLIRAAVEQALAEQEQTHAGATEDLIARFRGLLAEQEARHKRDLIVAQIGESTLWSATNPRLAERRIQQLRAELAALEVEP